jgi:4-amino-4-deoxy-L-arabinose transferase-like glycosyltransferase
MEAKMKKLKITKENLGILPILILSAILNFANIGIEGYGNGYYAAGVKSMTMSLKNFFFVSFDPAGFVTIDKPPLGFWIQTISAKIFGFSGWSILLPQALAGVISIYLIYYLVKRSFGTIAGLISALCLAVTPVFVAASRNNTIDNLLVVTLLFACLAFSIAAEKGKVKYLYISLVLVGIGFNIKMLEAYMIGPAIYITYLLSSAVSFKKKIIHLVLGTVILFAVSLSWAVIVDLIPAQNRPYVGSSTNNSVMELIIGHNGLERLGLGGKSGKGAGGNGNFEQGDAQRQARNTDNATSSGANEKFNQAEDQTESNINNPDNKNVNNQGQQPPGGNGQEMPGGASDGNGPGNGNIQSTDGGMQGGPGGQNGGLQGSFGGQTKAGITRLFSKNSLSDQIVWFIPLALLGFIAGAIKEKLRFKLDNRRKLSLVLWFVWLVPEFIYFSYTTGLFHPYYLTMMAPPVAALAGIGIGVMWQFYKEGGWKSWLLPIAFVLEGLTHTLMLSYYYNNISTVMKSIIIVALILCFISSAILVIWNILNVTKSKKNIHENNDSLKESRDTKLKKAVVGIALIGILITPFIGASAVITHKLNDTIPSAGLELLSNTQKGNFDGVSMSNTNSSNTKLIEFLKSNKTNEKYLLVVSSARNSQDIIIQNDESIMALGGFSGSDKILTLDQFKVLVKNGEVRYVLSGGMGMGGGANNEIMNWVIENGKAVSENEWKDSTTRSNQSQNNAENSISSQKGNSNSQNESSDESSNKNSNSIKQNAGGFGGNNSEQLYDLKDVANTLK